MIRVPSSVGNLRDRVDSMALRQRALLALALVGMVFLIADALLIRPQAERRTSIQRELDQVAERTAALNRSVEQLARQTSEDPDAALRDRLARIEADIAELENDLQNIGSGLARPDDALALLQELLITDGAIELDRMEKLPAETLRIGDDELPSIWIHRFRLNLRGPWDAILERLATFEALPTGLYLDTMRLEAVEGSTDRSLELVVYTLTLDEDWLDV